MSELIVIPAVILQTIKGDLEAITQAMSDLYIACGDGKLSRVAPHIVEHVGRLAEGIKDSLSDCEIEAKEPGTMTGFPEPKLGTFTCDPTARDANGNPLERDQLD